MALFAALACVAGCSALNMVKGSFKSDPASNGIDAPLRLHSESASADALAKTNLDDLGTYANSAAAPVVNYFSAMRNAYPKVRQNCDRQKEECTQASLPANLENYLGAGIGLVNDNCDRWFEILERSEKRLNYEVQNDNIIKQLGTTLLGIGGASRAIVATYGALNTATAGVADSFKGAFLFAPSANRAHVLVKTALVAKAEQLKQKFGSSNARKPSFIEVYNDLITYGEVCTDGTARRLITDAVSAAIATVSRDGTVVVQPNVSEETLIAALTLKLAQIKVDQAQSQLSTALRDLDALRIRQVAALAETDRLNQALTQKATEAAGLENVIGEREAALAAAQKVLSEKRAAYNALPDSDPSKLDADVQVQIAQSAATAAQRALDDLRRSKDLAQLTVADLNAQIAAQQTIISDAVKAIGERSKAVTAAEALVKVAKDALPAK